MCGTAHFDLPILTSGGYCGFDPERKRAVATDKIDGRTERGSGRNEGGRMCRYADGGRHRSMRGKHVMASPFSLSMVSHLQFAFSLHQRRLISSFPFISGRQDSSAHFISVHSRVSAGQKIGSCLFASWRMHICEPPPPFYRHGGSRKLHLPEQPPSLPRLSLPRRK